MSHKGKTGLLVALLLIMSNVGSAQVPLSPTPSPASYPGPPNVFIVGFSDANQRMTRILQEFTKANIIIGNKDTLEALHTELNPGSIVFMNYEWAVTKFYASTPIKAYSTLVNIQKRGTPLVSIGGYDDRIFPEQTVPQYRLSLTMPFSTGKAVSELEIEQLPKTPGALPEKSLFPSASGRVRYPGTESIASEFHSFSSVPNFDLADSIRTSFEWANRARLGPVPVYRKSPEWIPVMDSTFEVGSELRPFGRLSYRIIPYKLKDDGSKQFDWWNVDLVVTIEPGTKIKLEDQETGYEEWLTKNIRITSTVISKEGSTGLFDWKPTTDTGSKRFTVGVGVSLGPAPGIDAKMDFEFEIPDKGVEDLTAPSRRRTRSLYNINLTATVARRTLRVRQVSTFRIRENAPLVLCYEFSGRFAKTARGGFVPSTPWRVTSSPYRTGPGPIPDKCT